MKKLNFFKYSIFMLAAFAIIGLTACEDDDDPDPDPDPIVEDGFYVKGDGTALTELDFTGLMTVTENERTEEDRPELLELFVAVEAGDEGFNIVEVAGGEAHYYGPGTDFDFVPEDDRDIEEPVEDFWRGSFVESEDPFTVPEDGLYHVVIDTEVEIAYVAYIPYWGLIGGATPGGWADDTKMHMEEFDLESISFTVDDAELMTGEYKFRYSGNWKAIIHEDAEIWVNTNFGESIDNLVPGGPNIENEQAGYYDVAMNWTLEEGYEVTMELTQEIEEPDYPEALYMIGDGVGNWEWDETDLPMVPTHSNPHLFWKIVWMDAEGEFKFAPQREWAGDFGKEGEADEDGVYDIGGDNVPVPGVEGYYMVVVDLDNETIQVTDPLVYGIGDAFDTWDEEVEDNLFTVDNDNEVIHFDGVPADGDLRMHVAASTLDCDWWQAEFNIIDGEIEFRGTGDDQEAVPVSAGQNIILNFKEGTGEIE